MNEILYLDLETTGRNTQRNGIHQIACIHSVIERDQSTGLAIDVREVSRWDSFVAPFQEDEIDAEALQVSGVTIEQISNYPDPITVHKEFTDWMSQYVNRFNKMEKFVLTNYWGHFDADFLRQWFTNCDDKYYGSWFHTAPMDIASLTQAYLLKHNNLYVQNYQLGTIYKALKLPIVTAQLHDARTDVDMLQSIHKILLLGL